MKGSICYAKDYTGIKYDPREGSGSPDYYVNISIPDYDIPYTFGFMNAGEYDISSGWVKNANYDVSLFCATECYSGASESTYECGYVWRGGDDYLDNGYKEVNASAVGCSAINVELGRSLYANESVGRSDIYFAGGFSIGNPSL